jgi:hypothetical protein
MSIRAVFGAAVCMLFLATTAYATPTHWEFQGRFTSVSGSDVPAGVADGTPFRIVVGFDTAAALVPAVPPGSNPQAGSAGGLRYNYTSPMRWQIYAGTECNPCEVSLQNGSIILRDDFSNFAGDPPVAQPAVDGYSFGGTDDDTSLDLIMRGTTTDIVNGPGLALEPDPRLADLAIAGFQVCGPFDLPFNDPSRCSHIALEGEIDAVIRPTYGTGYIFTARDCRIANTNPNDTLPLDCFNGGRLIAGQFQISSRFQRWSAPVGGGNGGGVGAGSMSQTHAPLTSDIDASWDDGAAWNTILTNQLGLPAEPMGSMFGSISFGGPIALPVIKGNSFPSDIARTNSNLYAYQKYNYSGGVTALPLVLDLTYDIADNSNNPSINPTQVNQRPGGANLTAVLSIVDGSVAIEALRRISENPGLNALVCGGEASVGLPAGSILGAAEFRSPEGQSGPQAVVLPIESCASPGQPIQLAANQDFHVASGLQVPARGKAPQPPSTDTSVTANGFVDSANTLRVSFSPTASPALVAELVGNLEPACGDDCGETFEPDPVEVRIDLKPGMADNCVNVGAKGVVPVALFGSETFGVQQVVIDDSLKLGDLTVRGAGGKRLCSVQAVNGDSYPDLVCHFDNARSNWHAGQTSVTLTGNLVSGGAFEASDSVCLKP